MKYTSIQPDFYKEWSHQQENRSSSIVKPVYSRHRKLSVPLTACCTHGTENIGTPYPFHKHRDGIITRRNQCNLYLVVQNFPGPVFKGAELTVQLLTVLPSSMQWHRGSFCVLSRNFTLTLEP